MSKSRTVTVDAVTLAWLAGLLEGEGSFFMGTNKVSGKSYRYPVIGINMTDEDIIARVAGIFGTKTYGPFQHRAANRKPFWRTSLGGHASAELMRSLIPQMGLRRAAKIVEILSEWDVREPTSVRRQRSCIAAAAGRSRNDITGRFLDVAA